MDCGRHLNQGYQGLKGEDGQRTRRVLVRVKQPTRHLNFFSPPDALVSTGSVEQRLGREDGPGSPHEMAPWNSRNKLDTNSVPSAPCLRADGRAIIPTKTMLLHPMSGGREQPNGAQCWETPGQVMLDVGGGCPGSFSRGESTSRIRPRT
jgi:hypothetical protein